MKNINLKYYELFLKETSKHYQFKFFHEEIVGNGYCFLRHDVDFSVHRALEMAKLEHSLNAKSTYFLLPHCDFYNLFEQEITDLVFQIISLGHAIGLHFDSHFYKIDNANDLEKYIQLESNFLSEVFRTKIKSFSFHNTNSFTLSCTEKHYANLINTYNDYFFNNEAVKYCSDSFGIWRFQNLMETIENKPPNIHILTHPEWWWDYDFPTYQKVEKIIDGRAKKTLNKYIDFMEKSNMKIVK